MPEDGICAFPDLVLLMLSGLRTRCVSLGVIVWTREMRNIVGTIYKYVRRCWLYLRFIVQSQENVSFERDVRPQNDTYTHLPPPIKGQVHISLILFVTF